MRAAILLLAAIILTGCSSQPSSTTTPNVENRAIHGDLSENCENFAMIAAVVMNARQKGLTRREVQAEVAEATNNDPTMRQLVDLAYKSPVASTRDGKYQAVIDFAATLAQECVNAEAQLQ